MDGFLFAALFFFDGVGDAAVVAGAVVVVPCCCVHEATSAAPVKAAIKNKRYFFIDNLSFAPHRRFGCLSDSRNKLLLSAIGHMTTHHSVVRNRLLRAL